MVSLSRHLPASPPKPQRPRELATTGARGRGNYHLLAESELTELCLALGVPPEQTGTMSKVGLIAALRTRLLMSKHRGDHGSSASRFERLPAPSFADSRMEVSAASRRESGSFAHREAQPRGRAAESRRERERERSAAARGGTERRSKGQSTWKRSGQKSFDMTADDLNDMEATFRQQMHHERAADAHGGWMADAQAQGMMASQQPAAAAEAENRLRWFESSVLEYGLQINSMVQQGIGGDAANPASSFTFGASSAPDLGGNAGLGPPPGGIYAGGESSKLEALSASFAQLERRMSNASVSIEDSCLAAAVGSTVDEMLQGMGAAAANTEAGAYGLTLDEGTAGAAGVEAALDTGLNRAKGGGAGSPSGASSASSLGERAGSGVPGMAPWLEAQGNEKFGKFDSDGNGLLDRGELESAVGAFFAQAQCDSTTSWVRFS